MYSSTQRGIGMTGNGYDPLATEDATLVERGFSRLHRIFPKIKCDFSLLHFIRTVTDEAKDIDQVEQCVTLIRPGFFGESYQEELSAVLRVFKSAFPMQFVDTLSADSSAHQIVSTCYTLSMLEIIHESQRYSDLIVVPMQYGQKYAKESMDSAMSKYSAPHREFGFRLIDVLIMLLAHPEQLKKQLMIDCAGDICTVSGLDDHSPVLLWTKDVFILTYRPRYEKNEMYRTVTGFVPTNNLLFA